MKQRTFVTIIFLMAAVPMGGCGLSSQQRVEEVRQAIEVGQAKSAELDAAMESLSVVIEDASAALADPNLPQGEAGRIREVLAKAQTKLESIKPVKVQIDTAVAAWQEELARAVAGGVPNFGVELQSYGKALQVGGPALPAPVGPFVALGGVVLTALGTFLGKIQQKKKDQTALASVVASVDALLLENNLVADVGNAKAILKNNQSDAARTAVDAVKGR